MIRRSRRVSRTPNSKPALMSIYAPGVGVVPHSAFDVSGYWLSRLVEPRTPRAQSNTPPLPSILPMWRRSACRASFILRYRHAERNHLDDLHDAALPLTFSQHDHRASNRVHNRDGTPLI